MERVRPVVSDCVTDLDCDWLRELLCVIDGVDVCVRVGVCVTDGVDEPD